MSVGAIIFSRMSSSRLPGKAFMDIEGKTLLERVIDKAKCLNNIDHICIATSLNFEDDKIENYGKSRGIDVYRGSLHDVAGRAFEASKFYGYNHFLRICGDRPFYDTNLYDHLIQEHLNNNNDLTTNIFPRIVPPGFTGEIIKMSAFNKLIERTKSPEDREHVTTFFYRNYKMFKIQNVEFNSEFNHPDIRLVIDDAIDLNRIRWIASNLRQNIGSSNQIIQLARKWEKLKKNKI